MRSDFQALKTEATASEMQRLPFSLVSDTMTQTLESAIPFDTRDWNWSGSVRQEEVSRNDRFLWSRDRRQLWPEFHRIQNAAKLADGSPTPKGGKNGFYGFHDIRRGFDGPFRVTDSHATQDAHNNARLRFNGEAIAEARQQPVCPDHPPDRRDRVISSLMLEPRWNNGFGRHTESPQVISRGGNRTRTPLSEPRILSPVRLPISPLGQVFSWRLTLWMVGRLTLGYSNVKTSTSPSCVGGSPQKNQWLRTSNKSTARCQYSSLGRSNSGC